MCNHKLFTKKLKIMHNWGLIMFRKNEDSDAKGGEAKLGHTTSERDE